ncbi:MAG: hypothetical protein A3F83_01980 [Candidatus Glassbacteria bacterium RIFCSPLOWO2_12_FULL_58_11]|uniref:Transporter n=2 Tax=Candidatus Glassiibacteriota TaxID=1817805 RepID=A0A1F5Z014_9BACT|nr:MAG: hypothetical protein A2Z86_08555 [Candidatus Glassbacteria bacterium GWA2_58_10]OGG05693.1 MAG: hypothetical protein A3F83_01980 [Candidatus Glassbacteria bacterium RIFCSPLOWO2_12_FULL_58_11]
MNSLLITSFTASFTALLKIALIIAVSAWLLRINVFNETHTRALTALVVNLALPCLIFDSILTNFEVSSYPHWWKFPLLGAALTFTMLGLSRLVFWRDHEQGNTLSALATFQNAGYLILPIGEVLFPDQFGRFSVFLFLMLLGYNPLLWSVAKILVTHAPDTKIKLSQAFTAPFYTSLIAIFLVFTGLGKFVPAAALGSVALVGKSCVPMATVVLGLTMGMLKFSRMPGAFDTFRVLTLKLVVAPLLVFLVLKYTAFSSGPLENAFWILEAASPSATALALQAIHFGGDEKLICGTLFLGYLLALFTIPLFYSVAEVLL